ncbi:MAG TPA: riboflavin synthase [Gemmatimonadales bacterium]|nr:riboflavin synthase [Gemmatimonadales bacterium]
MFTGIITALGEVTGRAERDGGLELTIATPWPDLVLGESVAVDGACLTVQALSPHPSDGPTVRPSDPHHPPRGAAVRPSSFTAHIIRTSLDRTNFSTYEIGRRLNLERALQVGDRLGGHLVQGHVDGVGSVERVAQREDARLLDLRVPPDVARVSVPLGSITVDGVSLTVNAMPTPGVIQISLIPFTLQHTTLGERRAGDRVHLEADTIGKYVAELLRARGDLGTS